MFGELRRTFTRRTGHGSGGRVPSHPRKYIANLKAFNCMENKTSLGRRPKKCRPRFACALRVLNCGQGDGDGFVAHDCTDFAGKTRNSCAPEIRRRRRTVERVGGGGEGHLLSSLFRTSLSHVHATIPSITYVKNSTPNNRPRVPDDVSTSFPSLGSDETYFGRHVYGLTMLSGEHVDRSFREGGGGGPRYLRTGRCWCT